MNCLKANNQNVYSYVDFYEIHILGDKTLNSSSFLLLTTTYLQIFEKIVKQFANRLFLFLLQRPLGVYCSSSSIYLSNIRGYVSKFRENTQFVERTSR